MLFRFTNTFKKVDNKHLDEHIKQHLIAFANESPATAHVDNAWVEVQRSSTSCLYQYVMKNDSLLASRYFEGLSYGWPMNNDEFKKRTLQPYGCWFYLLRGTGIYVNVGKTLVQYSRYEAMDFLGIKVNFVAADYYFCRNLRNLGYDSLQIFNSHKPYMNELIICSGECITKKITASCVPVELRTGWNATKACHCNDTYPILNCNREITDKLDCNLEYQLNQGIIPTQKESSVKQTCFYEDFDWNNNVFGSQQKINIFFTNNRHGGTTHLPNLTAFVSSFKDKGSSILIDIGHYSHMNFEGNVSKLLEEMDVVGYDIVTMGKLDSIELLPKHYKFQMLSLFSPGFIKSTIINRENLKFGFIAYSHHNHIDIDLLAQVVLDEALCLKRWSDIIILIGDGGLDGYISQKLNKYVDLIISNSHLDKCCNGTFHSQNENVIIHSIRNISNVGLISFEIVNKEQYTLKSDILIIR